MALENKEAVDSGRRRYFIGFAGLALMAVLLAAITWNARGADRARQAAERIRVHTLNVLLVAGELRTATQLGIRGERGYLITRQSAFITMFTQGRAKVFDSSERLARITADNSVQRRNVSELRERLARYFALLGRGIASVQAGRLKDATGDLRSGLDRGQVTALLKVLDRVEAEEKRLLVLRERADALATARSSDLTIALCVMGFASLLASFIAARSALSARDRMFALTQQLRVTATTDGLTGLANRRSFLDQTDGALALAHRAMLPLSMAILDIDHFKQINDGHGHQAGDMVLREVAKVLRDTARLSDVVGRIGGEEFAVLMPDTNAAQAHAACERLRRVLAGHRFELANGGELTVTFSAGVAVLLRNELPERLLSRADDALYRAKRTGRNRVLLAA